MRKTKLILAIAFLLLAILACRKATPCDTNPAACVGTPSATSVISMQIVKDTPPAVLLLTPTPAPLLTATGTAAPDCLTCRIFEVTP